MCAEDARGSGGPVGGARRCAGWFSLHTSQGPVRLAEAGPESGEAVLLLRESRDPPAPQDSPSLPGWASVWEQAWASPGNHREQPSGARLSEAKEPGWGLPAEAPGGAGWGRAVAQSCPRRSNDASCQSRALALSVLGSPTPIKGELSVSLVLKSSGFQLGAS